MAKPLQFNVRFFFAVTLIVMAFCAGRYPMSRRIQRAKTELATANSKLAEATNAHQFFMAEIKNTRRDLFDPMLFLKESLRRGSILGLGTSKVRPPDLCEIKPRYSRWFLEFSSDPSEHTPQIKELGIDVVFYRQDLPQVARWNSAKRRFETFAAVGNRSLLLPGSSIDFHAMPDHFFMKREPFYPILIIAPNLENQLAVKEKELLQQRGHRLEEVAKTHFAFPKDPDSSRRIQVSRLVTRDGFDISER